MCNWRVGSVFCRSLVVHCLLPFQCSGLTPQWFDGAIVFGQCVPCTRLSWNKSKTKSQLTCKEDGFVLAVPEGVSCFLGQVGSRTRPFGGVCWVRVNVAVVGSAFIRITLGSRINFTCPVGITITGRISDSNPLSAVCGVFWSIGGGVEKQLLVPTSVCQRVSCGAPSAVLQAVTRVYGHRMIYPCEPGYVMSDGSTTFEREREGYGHVPPVHKYRDIDDCPRQVWTTRNMCRRGQW